MKGLYYRLIVFLDTADENSTNYNIAWYMVHHLEEISTIGISELAKVCFVSPATISRFSRTIGYENFAHLKQNCASNRKYRTLMHSANKIPTSMMKKNPHQATFEYVEKINQATSEMVEYLNWEQIDEVLKLIHDMKNVYFFGTQFSHSAALHLQADLLMMDKFTIAYIDYEKQLETAKYLDDESVAIIISVNGHFASSASKAMHYIKKANSKVVFITHDASLEEVKYADYVIELGSKSNGDYGKHTLLTLMELLSSRYYTLFEITRI